ncbi:LOW QUALITY PROTEIN: hypothetical protein HID58_071245, partial [Brassica napus]
TLATSCLYRKHLRKSSTGNLISSPSSLKLISYLPLISSSPSLYFVSDRLKYRENSGDFNAAVNHHLRFNKCEYAVRVSELDIDSINKGFDSVWGCFRRAGDVGEPDKLAKNYPEAAQMICTA